MLDTATKKRIDDCRDILVGKVPDPKSQVEQITIALIYKFMDDMDAEAEELGGSRSFFAGPFARFGWAKLMAPSLGGFEVLALYSEAIQSMRENPGVPELFRDIFKNAYLPYRDPETLKSFLKEINHFSYDHSERLGDAFEYLLSVLGSQGDAGQFRTPRHIIDFMVAVIDPQKHETILDPACGTAGFLISAWKHILAANTSGADAHNGDSKETNTVKREAGNLLTPDERTRLAANIKGYDISPDMVRLSLANLYLHGFADPHVVEYDTLTQDDKWNELADVILANPPFMSPKGGIKPHKRFSVQATRSEVLFVDYMAEHLSATGRAAIVVPEGIIFQSGTAYKALRKMLVESSLVAVVSLPAGVFNPYSGVKTSILVLDKRVHKQTSQVLFVKVQNDGFNLGAQRRAVVNSDLPEAIRLLRRWMAAPNAIDGANSLVQAVDRARIGEGGDFNLSGERYRAGDARTTSFPLVPIQDVAEVASGFGFPLDKQGLLDQEIPFLKVSDMNLPGNEIHINSWNHTVSRDTLKQLGAKSYPRGTVIFPKIGAAIATNKKRILSCESAYDNNVMGIVPGEKISPYYLYALLQTLDLSDWASESQPPSMRKSVVESHEIPLPSLEIQRQIVAEIEGYQKVIDGARQVLDSYRPHISIEASWIKKRFGDVTSTVTPPSKIQTADFIQTGRYPVIDQSQTEVAARTDDASALVDGTPGLVIFGDHTCAVKFIREPFAQGADGIKIIKTNELLLPKFAYFFLLCYPIQQDGYKRHFGKLSDSEIAFPDLETQRVIVAEIEAEQALVNANRELIRRMEAKIKTAIDRVWRDGGA